jgi:AhpD family alkylhydroperoxidase
MLKNIATLSFLALVVAATAQADQTNQTKTPAQQALAEAEAGLGFVPAFMRNIPEPMLPGMWDQLKSLEMNPKSALDGKTKELIGLAVASQIPCEFCIYFHTKAAKANGATDAQISEAIGMASLTREGSTILHGTQADLAQFRRDVDRIFSKGNHK